MATILQSRSIYYKDVNLIAQPGKVEYRGEIPKETCRIIVSPMSSVVGKTFARIAISSGIRVCLHRFCSIEDQVKLFREIYDPYYSDLIWAAVGLDDKERFYRLYQEDCRNFVIDIANGYHPKLLDNIKQIKNNYYNSYNYYRLRLIIGNIHSKEGMKLYKDYYVWMRVGISNGSGCKTNQMAAVGRGQITEIMECNKNKSETQLVCADGGISQPSYAALAFGAGARVIMLGGYFSKAEEAENVINGEYKFWGSASYKQLQLSGTKKSHSEGKELDINKNKIKPLKVLVDELWGGISSAVSYSGYKNLSEFIGNGVFEIKQNS